MWPVAVIPAALLFPETDWFPLTVGSKWLHRSGAGAEVVRIVTARERIGDRLGAKIEITIGGKYFGSEHLAVHADGVRRHAWNGVPYKEPILFLPLPPEDGREWNSDGNSFKSRKVRLALPPAEYDAIQVTCRLKDGNTLTVWYAQGLGPVREHLPSGTDVDLVKFEPAK